jgi:hypothetical protein
MAMGDAEQQSTTEIAEDTKNFCSAPSTHSVIKLVLLWPVDLRLLQAI